MSICGCSPYGEGQSCENFSGEFTVSTKKIIVITTYIHEHQWFNKKNTFIGSGRYSKYLVKNYTTCPSPSWKGSNSLGDSLYVDFLGSHSNPDRQIILFFIFCRL